MVILGGGDATSRSREVEGESPESGIGQSGAPSGKSGTAGSRFANVRAKVADEDARKAAEAKEQRERADAEAKKAELVFQKNTQKESEKDFRRKLKTGDAKRLDFGDGVMLDLIKVRAEDKVYFLGRYEVTQEQYQLVMGKNPSRYNGKDRAKHPVEQVSWDEAMMFCKYLNSAFEKEMEGYVFALPTAVEWQKAARGGKENEDYSGGDDFKIVKNLCWYKDNSENCTHIVGTKKPNDWGFHDMSGNVREWLFDKNVQDKLLRAYEQQDFDEISAILHDPNPSRSFYGGSCFDELCDCRVYSEGVGEHDARDCRLGFRVVAVKDDSKK